VLVRREPAELAKHREIVTHGPALGDLAVFDPVAERNFTGVWARVRVDAEERPPWNVPPLTPNCTTYSAQTADDPTAMTEAFARLARQLFDNTAALRFVLRDAAAMDSEAAALQESIEEQRRVGQARVARALASKGFLAPGLKEAEARDIVYALMSIDTYRILRLEQRWSGARYERWLAHALYRLLTSS
jgi:hypothetical protein